MPPDSAAIGAIESSVHGAVAEIRINRPERRNSLDLTSFRELRGILEAVGLDRAIRAVVLTGRGPAFCAGGDVQSMSEHEAAGDLPEYFHALTGEQEASVRAILGMEKPVVAALPGVAAGGGLSLALACDWRIGSRAALLVPAFSALGAVPDGGLTYFLPHFLGIGLAQELLFTHAKLDSERALSLGLLHEVVEDSGLEARSLAKARELGDGPLYAYGQVKRLLVAAFGGTLETQFALERRGAVEAARRQELPEGIRAFREKRSPRFAGTP